MLLEPVTLRIGDKTLSTSLYSMRLQPGITGIIGLDLLPATGITVSGLPIDFPLDEKQIYENSAATSAVNSDSPPAMSTSFLDPIVAQTRKAETFSCCQRCSACTHPFAVITLDTGNAAPVYRRQYPIPNKA
jgi:hypothetical protein